MVAALPAGEVFSRRLCPSSLLQWLQQFLFSELAVPWMAKEKAERPELQSWADDVQQPLPQLLLSLSRRRCSTVKTFADTPRMIQIFCGHSALLIGGQSCGRASRTMLGQINLRYLGNELGQVNQVKEASHACHIRHISIVC